MLPRRYGKVIFLVFVRVCASPVPLKFHNIFYHFTALPILIKHVLHVDTLIISVGLSLYEFNVKVQLNPTYGMFDGPHMGAKMTALL